MGHATRSRVVIESLLERHDVRVVASGAAFRYLEGLLPVVDEVLGPTFAMRDGEIQRWATVRQNVQSISLEAPEAIRHWMKRAQEWRPEVVITDFEPLAGMYARATRTPLIAVDNINMLDRCRHDREIVDGHREAFMVARAVTRSMVPGAIEYMVTTFFYPRPSKRQTRLVPPILRPEIIAAEGERGDHLVVYSSGEESALAALRASGVRCRVYGMRGGPTEGTVDGNLEFRPRSNEGFVEDLRTARAVVAGGGFSLMSEAVYLGKPMLALPLHGQFEQMMNSRYLEREGFGMASTELTPEVLDRFLSGLDGFETALAGYEQEGNMVTLREVEERAVAAAGAARRDLRRERRGARRRVRRDRSSTDDQRRDRS
ncbi:MAG: teichoic acid biosynthesis protein [Solirubrobacterales bacterium]|nr:teichoic acid biosynthesis protein [Solirubrobacterales bacterium]